MFKFLKKAIKELKNKIRQRKIAKAIRIVKRSGLPHRLNLAIQQAQQLSQQIYLLNLDKQRREKGGKIRVLLVMNLLVMWKNFVPLFDALSKNELFDPIIVLNPMFPIDEYTLAKYEKTVQFFQDVNVNIKQGYDVESGTFLDIAELSPHYVFFPSPYNFQRPPQYHSAIVSLYACVCHLHYGLSMYEESVILQFGRDFYQKNTLIFAETIYHQQKSSIDVCELIPDFKINQIHYVGWSGGECIKNHTAGQQDFTRWKQDGFRILWTPRWTDFYNETTFLIYKDILFQYAEKNKCCLCFRPHTLAMESYVNKGILSKEEREQFIRQYQDSQNAFIDYEEDARSVIHTADVLVSDPSGIVMEFFVTGKPIIYTKKAFDHLNDLYKKMLKCTAYWVHNDKELHDTLDMLRRGEDPLKETRLDFIKETFILENTGQKMLDTLYHDYMSKM